MDFLPHTDGSILRIVTLAFAAFLPYYVFVYSKKERLTGIPHVPSFLPLIGYGLTYFSSPSQNSVKLRKQFGDIYTMLIFGRLHCKIYRPKDVQALLRLPEKKASMLEAYQDLAGFSLPQPDRSKQVKEHPKLKVLLDQKVSSGTPLIKHSVRSHNIKAWLPGIQQVLQQRFNDLPTSGTVNLFDWCQNLIYAVTVQMMLGSKLVNDPKLLQQFQDLFEEADPESGFSSPLKSVGLLAEVAVRGERKIYSQVRELLFPLIDEEIEACIRRADSKDSNDEQDTSVLASLVSSWYHRKLNSNQEDLQLVRTRISNDLFNFSFAAFSNSFGMAAWVLFHYLRDTKGLQSILQTELFDENNQSTQTYAQLETAILEIGRLYTPGDVHRKLREDWTLPSNPSITLPKDTVLLVSGLTVHREESLYSDPCTVNMERDYKTAGGLFMPFGTGSHPCVGKRLALTEIALLVRHAITHLDMRLVPGEKDGMCSFTNQMISGIPNHPPMDLSQPGFIWRPADPITMRYQKKKAL